MKKLVSLALILCMILALSTNLSYAAPVTSSAEAALTPFAKELESKYVDPDRIYSADVRWWLGQASLTDESLLEEVQTLYDGGFRGVELCMQNDSGAPAATYAYGSAMYAHKWKLLINKLLDLGMGVYMTSGTNWGTSNVPASYLDPDSQGANQAITLATTNVNSGSSITSITGGSRSVGQFVGAYAYKVVSGNNVDPATGIDLTPLCTDGANWRTKNINWTAPADSGTWRIFSYWMQGTAQSSSPAIESCYAINYFDKRGVAALRNYWELFILDDPVTNAKILKGDVQLFMDSLEISEQVYWTEDFAQEFIKRKGYDLRPYLFLATGATAATGNPYNNFSLGTHRLDGEQSLNQKIVSDYLDVKTKLYEENYLLELKSWLNSVGIKTRAQISYGRAFEITEPSVYVDYPEAENLNQYNQIDIFRLHTAGAKLQNKVLSSETSAAQLSYNYTFQKLLRDAYSEYAAGFQRIIWHVWASGYGYGNYAWPGFAPGGYGLNWFHYWGSREPAMRDYDEFNAHLGRVQQLLREGRSRTDIGFIHNNWTQGVRFGGGTGNGISGMNWQLAHMGVYYRSTELQDNGYSYDYLSPELLFADGVYFDETTNTIELAGYKAIVLYQDWLSFKGAERILDWAKKGLKVVILSDAAARTTSNDGKDAELAAIIAELKTLPTVRVASVANYSNYFTATAVGYDDNVYEKLQELGVRPYAEYTEPNHQLLTQSRQDDDGNMYLYIYNYCQNDYHDKSYIASVQTEDHGLNIQTEIKMDGLYVPYEIDAWSGKATQLANYRYENNQTVFEVDLDYNNIALYAFEAVGKERLHVVSTNAESAYAVPGSLIVRATESGMYNTVLSNGVSYQNSVIVPASYDITNWDVKVESWTPNSTSGDLRRTETIGTVTTVNRKTSTVKTNINVQLPTMTTWNNITQVGRNVSGLGRYEATFNWDANQADGAYLDFGDTMHGSMRVWINGIKVGGDVCGNPTKVKKNVGGTIDDGTGNQVPLVGKDLYSGGISWTKPIVDVGAYLVDGANEIVIEYTSSLANVQLSRGIISVTQNLNSWWGNNQVYLDHGPSQAVIIPYVEQVITTASVIADICVDDANVVINNPASYTVSLDNTKGVGIVELSFTFDGYVLDKDSITVTPQSGFTSGIYSPTPIWQYMGSGIWKGTVKYMYLPSGGGYVNVDGPLDILKISGTAIDISPATITLTGFSVSGDSGIGVGAMPSLIRTSEATATIGSKPAVYSKYDLNKNGSIDETDLLYLVYFYQWNDRDAGWDTIDLYSIFAKDCDFQINGKVDLADMIELTANYGVYDPYI